LNPLHLSYAANATDGGIASAVTDLVAAQNAAGLNASWLTADRYPALRRDRLLLDSVNRMHPHLLHVHGLWRSPTRTTSAFESTGLPLVIAPHGMLNPVAFSHSRWKKLLVWQLWERRALMSSRCLHALCPAEASAIRDLLPKAAIAVIPNGVTVPAGEGNKLFGPTVATAPWQSAIPDNQSVLLFLGRFHSGKGISALLQAWQSVASEAERQGWWLVLVGYGDGGALQRKLSHSAVQRCMVFGPVFGAAKEAALTTAKAFVLPSHFEALPMAALEAMAHRLPCLLSTACNLPQAFTAGAALPAEPEPKALAASLQQLFALSTAERAAMGGAGQDLVRQQFSWHQVTNQTLQLYSWILGGGERPSFVEVV
jgi:poly(glycerol-phosphate) alpha-glucosyltransferase